jgi:hypothetical protein
MQNDSIVYQLTTAHNSDGVLSQKLVEETRGMQARLMEWVMDTREQGLRDALVKLGWTPPENK